MDKLFLDQVRKICIPAGFHSRGSAFFRIIGDGVLQVVKLQYQMRRYSYEISVGLFSMYGELQPEWFTASHCIPRYYIGELVSQSDRPILFPPAPNIQLDLLLNEGISYLDSINSQCGLVKAISMVDRRWNDELKFAPYLACGDIGSARRVLKAINDQHGFAQANFEPTLVDDVEEYMTRIRKENEKICQLQQMLDNPECIREYLVENCSRNMQYAWWLSAERKKRH